MKICYFFIWVLVINCPQIIAQQVRFKVVDYDSRIPAPFAHVISSDSAFGTISNVDGEFSIPFIYYGKHFSVSSVGYEDLSFVFDTVNHTRVVELLPKQYVLDAVEITDKRRKSRWINNSAKKIQGSYSWANGAQHALYIPESAKYADGFVRTIAIYVIDLAPNDYLRIRIYEKDFNCSCPGNELLDSNYLISGELVNEWVKIDVRANGLVIPQNGVFVAVEGVYKDDNDTDRMISIGAYSKPVKYGSFTFHKKWMADWKEHPKPNFKVSNVLNLAINVEVGFSKSLLGGSKKITYNEESYKAIRYKDLKGCFDSGSQKLNCNYPQSSFEQLVFSVLSAVENEDIGCLVTELFVFNKEDIGSVIDEIERRKVIDEWFPNNEKELLLGYWQNVSNEMKNAYFQKIDKNNYEMQLRNGGKIRIQVKKDIWKIFSNYSGGMRY